MLSTQNDDIARKSKRELKDYPLNKLYIALKIILLSSTLGMQNSFAADLPASDAGCANGTTTCNITSALGNEFDITANITTATNAIVSDASVANTSFTVGNGITVTGTGGAGFYFDAGGTGNTIINNGTIQGADGIMFNGGSNYTLTNNGLIDSSGGVGLYALANFGSNLTLTNNEGATISATHTVIDGAASSGGTTINNAGAIIPDVGASGVAINLKGSNNTINLNTSSNIIGDIQVQTGQAGNVINLLGGSAATGTFGNYLNSNSINTLNINAAGKEWDLTNTLPVAGAINLLAGNVVVTGSLSNTGGGGTTIASGTNLQIGNGGTTGALDDVVVNDGTLTFNRSDEVTFNDNISGTGNVVQAGSGITNLAGSGTWSGGTQVNLGTLNGMSATNALGSGAIDVSNGAILQLGDTSTFTDYYFSANALSLDTASLRMYGSQAAPLSGTVTYHFDNLTAPIDLSNSTLQFDQTAGADIVFDGDVNATNTSSLNYVADSGDHSLAMNGNLTGSGNFSVNITENNPGGVLGLAFNGAANNYTGTISLNGDAYTTDVNTLIGQAGWLIAGAQTLNFNNPLTHIATSISSTPGSFINMVNAATELQVGTGTIGGAGAFTKYSTGTVY